MDGVGRVDGAGDPIFQREQPEAQTKKSAVLVWQFFLVPLLIVLAALGVFLLFGAFAGSEDTPRELLDTLLEGGGNEKQQAAHQLALAINAEYRRVQRGDDGDTPFYAERTFQRDMGRALQVALQDNDEPTIQFVSLALGEIQAVEAIPLLGGILYPDDAKTRYSDDTRRRAAQGLTFYDGRVAESLLVRAAGDESDAQVRAIGLFGLSSLAKRPTEGDESPLVVRALRLGLDDDLAGARLNAAFGLAYRHVNEERVVNIVSQALTRDGLAQMDIPGAMHPQALRNACKAAEALGDPALMALVERLTDPSVEGDDTVRMTARQALARWKE